MPSLSIPRGAELTTQIAAANSHQDMRLPAANGFAATTVAKITRLADLTIEVKTV